MHTRNIFFKLIIVCILFISHSLQGQDYKNEVLIVYMNSDETVPKTKRFIIEKALNDIQSEYPELFFKRIIWYKDFEKEFNEFINKIDGGNLDGTNKYVISSQDSIYIKQTFKDYIESKYSLEINVEGNGQVGSDYSLNLYGNNPGKIAVVNELETEIVIPSILSKKLLKNINCSFDFKKEKISEKKLSNATKSLFNELTNLAPEVVVRINGEIYDPTDTFIVRLVKDKIEIDLSYSKDFDTEIKYLKYFWKQKNENGGLNPERTKDLELDDSGIIQRIFPKVSGIHLIEVVAYDGIEYSAPVLITLDILKPPKLLLNKQSYSEYTYISGFQRLFKPKKFGRKIKDQIQLSLANYPGEDWKINALPYRENRPFFNSMKRKDSLKIKLKEYKDQTYTLDINGTFPCNVSRHYYFSGSYKEQTTDTIIYYFKRPEVMIVSEFNAGFTIQMPLIIKGNNDNNIYPLFPFEVDVHTPLFYDKGHNNYLSLGAGMLIFLDERTKNTLDNIGGELSLRVSNGIRQKRKKFFNDLSYFIDVNYNYIPSKVTNDIHQIGLQTAGFRLSNKYFAINLELLEVKMNIRPIGLIFQTGVKVDLLEWTRKSQEQYFEKR